MIVTEYRQARTLEKILEDDEGLPKFEITALFFEILSALKALEKYSIIHRSIRPSVILIDDGFLGSLKTARLSGFSECCRGPAAKGGIVKSEYTAPEIEEDTPYGAKVDIYSLSKVVKQCIQGDEVDPEIETHVCLGLKTNPQERLSATKSCEVLDNLVGGQYQSPFLPLRIKQKFRFHVTYKDGQPHIQTSELLDAILKHHKGHSTRTFKRPNISTRDWSVRKAKNYCRKLDQDKLSNFFRDLDEAKNTRSNPDFIAGYDTTFTVLYHAPSMMFNITQFNDRLRVAEADQADECYQNVYGAQDYQGRYVDDATFRIRYNLLSTEFQLCQMESPLEISNQVLGDRFRKVDSSRYSILVTPHLNPNMILVRRDDWAVNLSQLRGERSAWIDDPSKQTYITPAEAFPFFERQRLIDLGRMIEQFKEKQLHISDSTFKDSSLSVNSDSPTSLASSTSIDPNQFDPYRRQTTSQTKQFMAEEQLSHHEQSPNVDPSTIKPTEFDRSTKRARHGSEGNVPEWLATIRSSRSPRDPKKLKLVPETKIL